MWNWFKSLFASREKSEYELLLEREADPNFVAPVRLKVMPDGSFKRIPYIKQPKPYRW